MDADTSRRGFEWTVNPVDGEKIENFEIVETSRRLFVSPWLSKMLKPVENLEFCHISSDKSPNLDQLVPNLYLSVPNLVRIVSNFDRLVHGESNGDI